MVDILPADLQVTAPTSKEKLASIVAIKRWMGIVADAPKDVAKGTDGARGSSADHPMELDDSSEDESPVMPSAASAPSSSSIPASASASASASAASTSAATNPGSAKDASLSGTHTVEDMGPLPPGSRRFITGLVGSASYNGLHGEVTRYDEAASRYLVTIQLPDGTSRALAVKAVNLTSAVSMPSARPHEPIPEAATVAKAEAEANAWAPSEHPTKAPVKPPPAAEAKEAAEETFPSSPQPVAAHESCHGKRKRGEEDWKAVDSKVKVRGSLDGNVTWFVGTVTAVHPRGGTCVVHFEDGDITTLKWSQLRKAD